MSGLVTVLLLLVAAFAIAFVLLMQIARRPAWSRLILMVVLTWASGQPSAKRPFRTRP